MPVRNVWEVRQRTWDRSFERSLGLFVDDMMAEQAIAALYREVWKNTMTPGYEPTIWLPLEAKAAFIAQGWDTWQPNDYNSPQSLFYKIPQQLWDQLPSTMTNFTFTLEDAFDPMVRVSI